MEIEKEKEDRIYGLIGKNISYSFSKKYFTNKWEDSEIKNTQYVNYDFEDISEVGYFLNNLPKNVAGLNVTIPYKQQIVKFLDTVSSDAKKIGAVNCIEITAEGKKIGHNTDWIGFTKSIKPFIKNKKIKAIILGSGGASKGVQFALKKLKIPFIIVSKTKTGANYFNYDTIEEEQIKNYELIINCTPLGTFPEVNICPEIPFQYLSPNNIVMDLIYNPTMTKMLKKAASQGSIIKNGYEMLVLQAEESWKIWNHS